jgi:hypothetical protein
MAAIIRYAHDSGSTPLITAVVFDMDGVLCRDRIERRLALLASWSGRTPDAVHAAIWCSGLRRKKRMIHHAITSENNTRPMF